MNLPLILLTALCLSSITLGGLCFLLHQRLMILEEIFPRLLATQKKCDDSIYGIRTVLLKSIENDINKNQEEIEKLKKIIKKVSDKNV